VLKKIDNFNQLKTTIDVSVTMILRIKFGSDEFYERFENGFPKLKD